MDAVSAMPVSSPVGIPANQHIADVQRYHEENFNEVQVALEHIERELRHVTRTESPSEGTITRLFTLLLGVWCEARLHKLLYEKAAFDEEERAKIYAESSVEQKWKKALEIAFRKHHGINSTTPLSYEVAGFSRLKIYEQILQWLDDYFVSVMQLRNKIAHGQWIKPFVNYQSGWTSSADFKISGDSIAALKRENLLSIILKAKILQNIAVAINNLAIDGQKYEAKDFDVQHGRIHTDIKYLESADFAAYRQKLIDGYKNRST